MPPTMASRTSFVQVGQSESVRRGKPRGGFVLSQLFGSGSGAHDGWNARAGIRRFTHWKPVHAAFAAAWTPR